jgi:hypothetical protein
LSTRSEQGTARSIQGQLLRQSERREVAIFLRDGALWVADFIDGQGQLIDATTWFRFNCGAVSTSHARRRMVFESAVPLSEALVGRIERLPRPATVQTSAGLGRMIEALARCLPRSRFATMVAYRLGRQRRRQVESKT